jgi:hypothetical protein
MCHQPVPKPRRVTTQAATPAAALGTVEINADRGGRDMGQITEEVLQHLTASKLKVMVEIEADIPEGASEDVQRVVQENCQTLRFKIHDFE